MQLRKITVSGIDAMRLSTQLLQRIRLADDYAGVYEAADIQWAWRVARKSDGLVKTFWLDEVGPVAGIEVTSSPNDWQINPIVIPNSAAVSPETVWSHVMEIVASSLNQEFIIPVADDDHVFHEFARQAGFTPSDTDSTGWMNARDKPAITRIADNFAIVNRTMKADRPHPMIDRNGHDVAHRLQQCSLYDSSLDLAVEAADGSIAGYSLYWMDPVTKVGLVEPVRVHEKYQRLGLARAMLTYGIDQLVAKGAVRIKVSWETEAAGSLYLSVGFRQQSTTTWYSTAGN